MSTAQYIKIENVEQDHFKRGLRKGKITQVPNYIMRNGRLASTGFTWVVFKHVPWHRIVLAKSCMNLTGLCVFHFALDGIRETMRNFAP